MGNETNTDLHKSADKLAQEALRFEVAMDLADGDEKEARNLMRPGLKTVVNVKAKFYEYNLHVYGAVSIFYDTETNTILKIVQVINYNEETYALSPFAKWVKYRKDIEGLAGRQQQGTQLEREFLSQAQDDIMINRADEFKVILEHEDTKKLVTFFEDLLLTTYKRPSFRVEATFERLNVVDFYISERRTQKHTQAGKQNKKTSSSFNGRSVQVTPVVSPLTGVLITQLAQEDVILVYITDETPFGKRCLQFVEKKLKMKNPKIPAVINEIQIDKTGHSYRLAAGLGGNVVGVIDENDLVKVMKVNESHEDRRLRYDDEKKKRTPAEQRFFYFTIITLILSGLAAFATIFLSTLGFI